MVKALDEMIEIMKAFADGEEIESCLYDNNWSIDSCPCWNWDKHDYRIKPKVDKRPMTPNEIINWFRTNLPIVYIEETSNVYPVLGFLGFVFNDDGSISKYIVGDCSYDYETFITYAHMNFKDGSKFEIKIKEDF